MTELVLPTKALAVNPLKASQPIGASLAILGLEKAIPLEHGARGCTSFNKLFFMRHFRDPIALQTTAMDQVTTIIGADENVVEALATICVKDKPAVIGLISTGLSETQGADLVRTLHEFRARFPEHAKVAVVPVRATDSLGCLESGFALAVEALIDTLVPKAQARVRRTRRVNILASAMLTPGDVETVKAWVAAFGLEATLVPDIADSLDGHLIDSGFSTTSYGGTPVSAIAALGEAAATLTIGPSLNRAADMLHKATGVADYRFQSLTGLDDCDAFTRTLATLSGQAVPGLIERQRDQLQDAMVDCQFQLGGARIGIAADPDQLAGLARFFTSMGARTVALVASTRAEHLRGLPGPSVVVGDLEDLEYLSRQNEAEMIVANSHGADVAGRLGAAFMRAGFPVYDSYGFHTVSRVGYAGTRTLLFEAANHLARHYQDIRPYRSRLRSPDQAASPQPLRSPSC